MVNFDCRHALVAHAEHFVAVYEADPSAANRADARFFVAMLKDSDCKERLLKRLKLTRKNNEKEANGKRFASFFRH